MAESSIKKFCEDKKRSREKVMVYSNFLEVDYKEVESLATRNSRIQHQDALYLISRGDNGAKQL